MLPTNLNKRYYAAVQDSDIDNKRLRFNDGAGATISNEMVGSSSTAVPIFSQPGIETGINNENWAPIQATPLKYGLASPESPQRHQTQGDIDNGSDSDATTVINLDGVESGMHDLEFEGLGWEEDDDFSDIIVAEGVYADLARGIRERTGRCFPMDMLDELEAIRLRVSHQETQSSTFNPPSSHKAYVIIHAWEPTHCHSKSRARDYEVVSMALSQDKANAEAMGYFYLKNPNHLRPSTASQQNCYQSQIMEVRNYHDINDFEEFFETSGTRNCSAWGIKDGCLALLAIHGLSGLDMVYVEEAKLID
ncbi:hypothetical protein F4776DRAFT_603761 [Hypoxylon sp. NC0597]|nr:hypothetical protein F4776DRAFT_603761 [Hypoxylon sp. NC0597]